MSLYKQKQPGCFDTLFVYDKQRAGRIADDTAEARKSTDIAPAQSRVTVVQNNLVILYAIFDTTHRHNEMACSLFHRDECLWKKIRAAAIEVYRSLEYLCIKGERSTKNKRIDVLLFIILSKYCKIIKVAPDAQRHG